MKNILIVEDSKVINNLVKNELDNLNYNCHQAFDFKKAEVFLKKIQYDLIILDLHLPDGEGYELINQVKSLTDTRVVILTGNTEKQLREDLFHHGVLDYIIKDKNLSFAIAEIHKVLKHLESKISDKILLIDDSAFMRKQMSMILTPRNYQVSVAKDATEGLDLLLKEDYNLVILDMELPDMHGSEVLEKIKSNPKYINLPVLIISGTTNADLIRNMYKMGASDFIRKPFIIEEFALKVDIWCDYRKKHLLDLEQKDKLLSQQSKMATMGEMVENIIHQSRQPLSVITAVASGISLEQEYSQLKPETLMKNLDVITQSAMHLSETMESFRDFFKKEDSKRMFNLSELLEKSFELTSSKFETRNIQIIKGFEDINMYGFDIELLQVFINILNNARDEFEKKDIKDRFIFIDTKNINNNISISIKDNAGGVPKDIIDNIFDSYFTTKEDEEGTGIGLYMSKEIVTKHHNGSISVKNKNFTHKDKVYTGAVFEILIPNTHKNL